MGWSFTYGASRKDIIADLIKSYTGSTRSEQGKTIHHSYTNIAHCFVGNTMWAVVELKRWNETGIECTERFISCILLQKSKEGWGYKEMSEGMGPYQYTCPPSYFEMAPTLNQDSLNWRKLVLEFNKKKAEIRAKVSTMKTLQEFSSIFTGRVFEYMGKTRTCLIGREKSTGKAYRVKMEDVNFDVMVGAAGF